MAPGDDGEYRRLGFWLEVARRRAGLTQEFVAARIGYSQKSKATISKWESGERKPSLTALKRLAKLYRVPLDLFVNAPPSAFEQIDELALAAAELEREDWEAGEGGPLGPEGGHVASPDTRPA
jgi:transcriptional regulator with XRE-family HTH domain